jgi:hypothetical protein
LALGVGKVEALGRHALLRWSDCLRQSTAGFVLVRKVRRRLLGVSS